VTKPGGEEGEREKRHLDETTGLSTFTGDTTCFQSDGGRSW
jgi:hypothetical protein